MRRSPGRRQTRRNKPKPSANGLGHCPVIVLAGTSAGLVQRYLNWNEKSKGAIISKRMCGGLVPLAGLYLIYIAK